MYHYRYGKLRFSDLGIYWFICAIMFLLGCGAIVFSAVFCFFPKDCIALGIVIITVSFAFFFPVFTKMQEQFSIDNNVLSILNFQKKRDISLPSRLTIIITYADFMPPLATRSTSSLHMRQTIDFHDRYEAVLLEGEAKEIIPVLRRYRYSSSHIEEAFENRFIYSFICNQEILDGLICRSECSIIAPLSLTTRFTIKHPNTSLWVDNDF